MNRIAVIRMKGKFSLSPNTRATLQSINLPRLYSCTLLPENDTTVGMLQACKDVVSFGHVDEQTVLLLLAKRGKTRDGKKLSVSKKPDEVAKLAKEISSSDKTLSAHPILPIFFLSPPKGGLRTTKFSVQSGGVLGKNEKIGELISRMA